MKEHIQALIDSNKRIQETYGRLIIDNFYIIERQVKDYYHKGFYQLRFDLFEGLFFYIVALSLEKDKTLGLSQWLLQQKVPVKDFYRNENGVLRGNLNDDIVRDTIITPCNRQDLFTNTELSWSFIIRSLDEIKSNGKNVPYELYPFEYNEKYDSDKTIEFIQNN